MSGAYVLFFRQSLASLFTCGIHTPGRWQAFARLSDVSEPDVSAIVDALPELIREQDETGFGDTIDYPAHDFHFMPLDSLQADRKAYLLALADLKRWKDDSELQGKLRYLLDGLTPAVLQAGADPRGGAVDAMQPKAIPQDLQAHGAGNGQRVKRRRRKTDAAPRPITAKQLEAAQIVAECKGNFSEAARRLGVSAKTVREHYHAGLQKLGRKAVKHGTQRLPSDRRGQDSVSSDDDRRRG
jgi:predicted DNA-binding protein (UPF0251 family)